MGGMSRLSTPELEACGPASMQPTNSPQYPANPAYVDATQPPALLFSSSPQNVRTAERRFVCEWPECGQAYERKDSLAR